MNTRISTVGTLPYLSEPFLEGLAISTADAVGEIERHIVGQRQGTVWCAPKAVVLPGGDRYIMATLGVASEPGVIATKLLFGRQTWRLGNDLPRGPAMPLFGYLIGLASSQRPWGKKPGTALPAAG